MKLIVLTLAMTACVAAEFNLNYPSRSYLPPRQQAFALPQQTAFGGFAQSPAQYYNTGFNTQQTFPFNSFPFQYSPNPNRFYNAAPIHQQQVNAFASRKPIQSYIPPFSSASLPTVLKGSDSSSTFRYKPVTLPLPPLAGISAPAPALGPASVPAPAPAASALQTSAGSAPAPAPLPALAPERKIMQSSPVVKPAPLPMKMIVMEAPFPMNMNAYVPPSVHGNMKSLAPAMKMMSHIAPIAGPETEYIPPKNIHMPAAAANKMLLPVMQIKPAVSMKTMAYIPPAAPAPQKQYIAPPKEMLMHIVPKEMLMHIAPQEMLMHQAPVQKMISVPMNMNTFESNLAHMEPSMQAAIPLPIKSRADLPTIEAPQGGENTDYDNDGYHYKVIRRRVYRYRN